MYANQPSNHNRREFPYWHTMKPLISWENSWKDHTVYILSPTSLMSDKKRKQEGEVYSIFKKHKSDAGHSDVGVLDADAVKQKLASFQASLDFAAVSTEEEIAARFNSISHALLQEFRLVIRRENAPDMHLELLEAELYLQLGGCHEDPFTHGSEEQRVSGRWYFHRAPRFSKDSHRSATSLTEYRSGSRKGLDLTIGGPAELQLDDKKDGRLLRGGILLRSVRQISTGKVTSGPSLLVDLILSASRASGIEELVRNKWGKDTSAFFSTPDIEQRKFSLFLQPVPLVPKPPKMYYSPRIGLDLSHPGTTSANALPLHPRIRFLSRKYRFFTHPELLVANGRPQTLLAALDALTEESSSTGSSTLNVDSLSKRLSKLIGVKEGTAARYLTDYNIGREAGTELIDSFIGPKGKGASSSPATYMKLMGALSTLDVK